MATRRLFDSDWLEVFDEGLDAATVPRWLRSCGAELPGKCAEDSAIGTCRRQIDSDAGGPLDDARSDLDQAKAHCGELCIGQLRACGHGAAHGEHEPVGGGVQVSSGTGWLWDR